VVTYVAAVGYRLLVVPCLLFPETRGRELAAEIRCREVTVETRDCGLTLEN
jgi:hypothetical protein